MKHTGTKALSWLLSLALMLSLMPGMSMTALAADNGKYREYTWDATSKTLSYEDKNIPDDAITLTAESTAWADGGWYIVPEGGVTIGSRIAVTGTANLILRDGATLTAGKGITVNSENTLNIYAQSAGTGELISRNSSNAASIGGGARYQSGGTVNIHGGNITAIGGAYAAGIGGATDGGNGEVNIYGGNVTAQGDNFAAGIGGYSKKSGGTVSIYGGTVNASGSINGVGIGIGGTEPGSCIVNIYGGDVTASSGKQSGIQGTVNIGGGTVTANGGTFDSLDGYSGTTVVACNGIGGTVTINGGTVTAFGGNITITNNYENAIYNDGGTIYACSGIGGTVTISGGTVTATGGNVTGTINNSGGTIYACNGVNGTVTISGGTVTATGGSHTGNSSGTTVKEKGFGGSLTLGDSMKVLGGDSADPTTEIEKSDGDYARYKYMLVKLGHVHSFTYEASDATITATCTATGCTNPAVSATLTINAPTLSTYGGTESETATLTGLDAFNSATGKTIATTDIKYIGRDGTTYEESTTAPTDAGKYTAKITVEEKTASVNYEIAKADPTAPTSLTATYGQTLANVTLPTGWTWANSSASVGDVGNHTFKANFAGDDNYNAASNVDVSVTVNKAANPATVSSTASVTKGGKTLDLSSNVTLNGATGTVSYEISGGDNGCTLSDSTLTSGADTGSVTVNVTVGEDSNYNALTAQSVTVTITDKETQTITAENVTATYGDTGKAVSASTNGDGTLSYAIKSGDAVTVDASTGALTIVKAGTATVTVTAAETDDYAAATKDVTVTINKKAVTVTADNKSMTVGSTAPVLTSTVTGLAGSDQAGVLTVSLECEYEIDTPGTYTIVASGNAEQGNYTVTYQNGTLTIRNRPSSGGSSSSSTVTVPVSGDDETVNVTVRVSGDTATVTGANVDKVLEAEDVGTVTIDVSSLKQNVTEVSIPGTMVKKIADAVADESNNADGLEIKLPTGTVTFDGSAVAAISEQANGKDLRLNLEDIGENKLNTAQKDTVRDMDVQEVLDAYMTSNGQRIRDFRGGRATVTVPYELKAEQRAAGVTVWYVADNGDKTEMPSTYDGKDVKFTVEHFSNYVIAYDAERAAACPKDDSCPVSAFTDTDPGAWYHDGVHYALEKGLMNGVGDNRFDPNGTASRGMIVTILYRLEGEPEAAAENPFGDVVDGQWYTNAVIWAAENKIVDGYGGGKFGPNDHITREQLVTILYRYAKWKGVDVSAGEDTNILSYDDAFDVSEWAIPAMQWAVGSSAVGGRTNTTLNPKDTATRAEAATIIMRYCTEIAK